MSPKKAGTSLRAFAGLLTMISMSAVANAQVVISQVYGGGGNSGAPYTHDFVELFNRGASSESLSGLSIQYTSATGTGLFSQSVTALAGSIAPGQHYLVQMAAGAGAGGPLPVPDRTGTAAMSASAGKVALVNSTTGLACNGGSTPCTPAQLALILDLVGYGSANFFEGGGAAPALSNTTAAFRAAGGCTDTNSNSADFAAAAPSPRNTASPLNVCAVADTAPSVTDVVPASDTTGVLSNANLSVTFSEPVNVVGAWYAMSCTMSGSVTAAVSGGPTTFILDPSTDLAGGETCTVTVLAAQVTDQDTDDPPDAMGADYAWSFTVAAADPCAPPYTPIPDIQGSGAAAAITGPVSTKGVVVGDFEGPSPTLRGFYLQDAVGDGDAATSDGIFVFNGNNNSVNVGDLVRVTGTASDFQGQTQVSASSIIPCGTGTVTPVDVTLPFGAPDFLERFEGMLVRLPQTLFVTEHSQLGRFGQVVLSSGGRLKQPTDVHEPGFDADVLQAANDLNRLIIDDGPNAQNPDPIVFGRGGNPLSASNTLRGGDTATGIVGVMTYTWGGNSASPNAYRVRPVGALNGFVSFDAINPRQTAAPVPAGALRVASMNLLNFFNTFDGLPDTVDNCTNGAGGAATDCRGADTAAEFGRQWPKTVAAILGTQADVIGVIELENDGYGPTSAIQFLVDKVNEATAPGTYAFIDVDAATGQVNALGTDAIKVGLIYKTARAVPIGQTAALNSVGFVNGGDGEARNRPALAQAFEEFGTGARLVVTVNHLKSKGSACDAPDAGDGQGNCNLVRKYAATELVTWLATDPTGSGDPDALIIGDLNSYSKEDPISTITLAGYTNLGPSFGSGYTYLFDGQWGSLDHALASATLSPQVQGVGIWYINADEPSVLDYNTDFKTPGLQASLYAPDEFRMADHNPVLVDLDLQTDVDAAASVSAGGEIELIGSAGIGAGDSGSRTTVALNGKFQKEGPPPRGTINVVIRRTETDGLHVYQVKATTLSVLSVDRAAGRGTVIAPAVIQDITDPAAPLEVDPDATVRVTMKDNGEPGIFVDTVGITVWTSDAALWFSSKWNGLTTVEQTLAAGNVQVR